MLLTTDSLMWHQKLWVEAADKNRIMLCRHPRRAGMTLADAAIAVKQFRKSGELISHLYLGTEPELYKQYLLLFGLTEEEINKNFYFLSVSNHYDDFEDFLPVINTARPFHIILDTVFYQHPEIYDLLSVLVLNPNIQQIRIFSSAWENCPVFDSVCKPEYWQYLGISDCYYQDSDFKTIVANGLYKKVCEEKGEVWTQESEDQWVLELYAHYGETAKLELDLELAV